MIFILVFLLSLSYGISSIHYEEFSSQGFVSLEESGRLKREASKDGIDLINETEWRNTTVDEVNHVYYKVVYPEANEENFKRYWVDTDSFKEGKSVYVPHEHPQLKNSYRKAVTLKTSFAFPFYGYYTHNVTIATGGFCYIGDHMHSWLAATQYIAPLMANFETDGEDSSIVYLDTGNMLVVDWKNVSLKHQAQAGNYSFQVSLHKNGSIWFVYKEVPTGVSLISDAHHPRKVGLSDAYLFQHGSDKEGGLSGGLGKTRVIYEYHRVEINFTRVKSLQVIDIVPNPVCISIRDCGQCVNATLEGFDCFWCPSGEGGFCTDEHGRHRRHQEFISGNCREHQNLAYCTEDESKSAEEGEGGKSDIPIPITSPTTSGPAQTTDSSPRPPPVIAPTDNPENTEEALRKEEEGVDKKIAYAQGLSSGGIIAVLFISAIVLIVFAWVLYAYYNPHTRSGQLLIKYRPGRWRVPGAHGDVRYTASVHM